MADINLVCNYKKCRVVLKTLAWVTSCSHIFCDKDGNQMFNQEKYVHVVMKYLIHD